MFGQRYFRLLAVALLLAGFWCLGQQEGRSQLIGEGVWKTPASGSAPVCAANTAFQARTSGMDTAHQNAFANLICGMVTDGVFSTLDAMYVFDTNSTGNAVLNLVSSSFTATLNNAPAFLADAGGGYTGDGVSTSIDTGFNPFTATTPNYVAGSSSFFGWKFTNLAQGAEFGVGSGFTTEMYINVTGTAGAGNINGRGLTWSSGGPGFWEETEQGGGTAAYQNGASVGTSSAAVGIPNTNLFALKNNTDFTTNTVSVFGFGSGHTPTQAAALYNRVHTYMHTIAGVP